jgi:hypothetical protein
MRIHSGSEGLFVGHLLQLTAGGPTPFTAASATGSWQTREDFGPGGR